MKTARLYMRCSVFLLLALLTVSCGGKYANEPTPPAVTPASVNTKKVARMNEAILASATPQTNIEQDYRIGPQDLLEIDAYNVEELKKSVRVNSDGYIGLPLVGPLSVKGLTTRQVEQLIAGKIEKYVQEPLVNVMVKEYKSQRITVIGAVRKSGVFTVSGQMYLIDMLMMADGLSEQAGGTCYIIRPGAGTEGKSGTIIVDLDELLYNGNMSINLPIFSGDVINVPKGGVFFVDGLVKSPGVYALQTNKTTLVQAFAIAKGPAENADLNDVRIFRDNGKGGRDIITADYEAIRQGQQPDIVIAENDIIIVPQDGAETFFKDFIGFLRGIFSFGIGGTIGLF